MKEKIDFLNLKINNSDSKDELFGVFIETDKLIESLSVNSCSSVEYENLDDLHLILFDVARKLRKII